MFEEQFYHSLDLDAWAKAEYGPLAQAISIGDHLDDWRVKRLSLESVLNVQNVATAQHGDYATAVPIGIGSDDWRAIRFVEPGHFILPTMIVASDLWRDAGVVTTGLQRFSSVLTRVLDWYNGHFEDANLRFLSPILARSSIDAAEWDSIAQSTTESKAKRSNLLNNCIREFRASYPVVRSNLIAVLAPLTGDSEDVWTGAAKRGQYAVAAPDATSVLCPAEGGLNEACGRAAYAIGHELGHALGLDEHTCDAYPDHPRDCESSIMQAAQIPDAILLQREVCRLLHSSFLHQFAVRVRPVPADSSVCVIVDRGAELQGAENS